ncbi:serine/threonine protein phosphatase [Leptospira hartskeerlii]|uniref:Serine/threonine protein phosphatase n=1 Tax=Leptospira hartskeerlii TaxID=2023177 RepID=A0A2M9XGB8_9LEPT|nr:PP2C family protein-serine/threonine phosphatase [Leptospira hartskeerlii]PJZ26731.1 serine/threonine protein phosphatase [Leptospira hartskeerlii]PJZ34787.1 serine/threonine protein phosphatase [Leptospira hartskeerlii]
MEEKKELITERIIASGPITINRIRFGLAVLFLISLAAAWTQSSMVQNIVYLIGIGSMLGYAIYNQYCYKKFGKIPSMVGKVCVLADITILSLVMFVASWTDRNMASGVIRQIILYAINMIFIVYSVLLLSPTVAKLSGIFSVVGQGLVILNTIFRGVEFTEDELKVISPGYASISEQSLKLVFLAVVSYITRSVILIFRRIGAVEEEYANTLEQKVDERTIEVTKRMEEIHALKVQQDGDYYLTSLLSKPLMTNWNTSQDVSTIFYIEQKKKFTFKNRESELGGDICISGNLLFGSEKEKWTFFLNGDAMGKSLQGAGGAIVLGTAVNNILSRSASHGKTIDINPEAWMLQTHRELDEIFRTFDGTMMASAIFGLIHDKTGKILILNAEHPWPVLFRDDRSSFLAPELSSWKLGSPFGANIKIHESYLQPGDVLFLGSDGRDDINISSDGINWKMNEDENQFVRIVEDSKGDLDTIAGKLHGVGAIADDLSLMRIGYKELIDPEHPKYNDAVAKYNQAKQHIAKKEVPIALELLELSWNLAPSFKESARLIGQIYYDKKEFSKASKWLERYLNLDQESHNIWFLLSLCYKHMKEFQRAADAAEKVRQTQPHRLANLINLSDNYRLLNKFEDARSVLEKAKELDGESALVGKLDEFLKAKGF